MVNQELSDQLTGRMPIIPHETVPGIACCGSIVATVDGANVELLCECGAVVGVVRLEILKSLLALDCAKATCPYCAREHRLPAGVAATAYICHHCGKLVDKADPGGELDPGEWVVRTFERRPPESPAPAPPEA